MATTTTTTNPYAVAWSGLRQAVSDFDQFENPLTRQNALGRIEAFGTMVCALTGRDRVDVLATARRGGGHPDWMAS